jgi:adenylate cyclase
MALLNIARMRLSSWVCARLCEHNWANIGEFPIAGFSKAERIYGLAEETPSSTMAGRLAR